MLLVCHKSIVLAENWNIRLHWRNWGWSVRRLAASLRDFREPDSLFFYVFSAVVLLQIPKTNCDEKFAHETLKYAPVSFYWEEENKLFISPAASSAFRNTFFWASRTDGWGTICIEKRNIPLALHSCHFREVYGVMTDSFRMDLDFYKKD